jgi:hypothetical protein
MEMMGLVTREWRREGRRKVQCSERSRLGLCFWFNTKRQQRTDYGTVWAMFVREGDERWYWGIGKWMYAAVCGYS